MNATTNLRLGVVVPPENPTAEPEFQRLLGASAAVYATRFPTTPHVALRQMLETYNDVLPAVLTQFGRLPLDVTVVACSASHYLLGPDGDRRFCQELSAGAGHPVVSPTLAVLAACRAVGIDRVNLVSPYQPWLTDTSRGYWQTAGIGVADIVEIPARTVPAADEDYDPYTVTTSQIIAGLDAHGLRPDAPLLFTGTGMATMAALDELGRRDPDRVLLTSNLVSAWWALSASHADTTGVHPLLRRLVDRFGQLDSRIGEASN